VFTCGAAAVRDSAGEGIAGDPHDSMLSRMARREKLGNLPPGPTGSVLKSTTDGTVGR
jgi:hypothetical protein